MLIQVCIRSCTFYLLTLCFPFVDGADDQGWKVVHTDVFRFPAYPSLLSSILGAGVQFIIISLASIVLALLGTFNVHRHGSMNTAVLVLYAFTCAAAGWVSARFYQAIDGKVRSNYYRISILFLFLL